MGAILSKVINHNLQASVYHPITMVFIPCEDSTIEYNYGTSVETQRGLEGNSIYDDVTLNQQISYIESNIGKEHDINLYDFTFSELTKGKYKAYKNTSYLSDNFNKIISQFHVASFKTRDDAMYDRINMICIMCLQGDIVGIKESGEEELIDDPKNVFYDTPDEYVINDKMLRSVTTEFIIDKVNVDKVSYGEILVNKDDFSDCRDMFILISEIQKYRETKSEVQRINSSLKKRIFFWEEPEPLPCVNLTDKELVLLKTSYLYDRNFHERCSVMHRRSLERNMQIPKGPFSEEARAFRQFMKEDSKKRLQKYKGVNVGKIAVVE